MGGKAQGGGGKKGTRGSKGILGADRCKFMHNQVKIEGGTYRHKGYKWTQAGTKGESLVLMLTH